MAIVLMPLPSRDFDPTETGVPWLELTRRGHQVRFATPDGSIAHADQRIVHGTGLGPLKAILRADANGRAAYEAMTRDASFNNPWDYERARHEKIDGLLLPGGHARGMRVYLESAALQAIVTRGIRAQYPRWGHLSRGRAGRTVKERTGRSVLFGRRTTALTSNLELTAWAVTAAWLGNYYRTYPETVQSEVTRSLEKRRLRNGSACLAARPSREY